MENSRVQKAVERLDGYRSFTGQDIQAYAYLPFLDAPIRLGALSFIDMSTMRTKAMVTSLGRANGRGFTRGARVVTGVMSFVQLDRSPFSPLYNLHTRDKIANYGLAQYADELPPFSLLLTYVNDYGEASYRLIETIEIVQEQFRDSIDEVNPQNTFSFVALHVSALTPLSSIRKKNPESGKYKRALNGKVIKSTNGKPAKIGSYPVSDITHLFDDYKEILHPGGLFDQGVFGLDDISSTYGLTSLTPQSLFPTSTSAPDTTASKQVKRPSR